MPIQSAPCEPLCRQVMKAIMVIAHVVKLVFEQSRLVQGVTVSVHLSVRSRLNRLMLSIDLVQHDLITKM